MSSHGSSRTQERERPHRQPGRKISSVRSQGIIPTQEKQSQEEEISRPVSTVQTKKPRTLTELSYKHRIWDSNPACVYLGLYPIFWSIQLTSEQDEG